MAIGLDCLSILGIVGLLIAHPFDTGMFGRGFHSAMAVLDCEQSKSAYKIPICLRGTIQYRMHSRPSSERSVSVACTRALLHLWFYFCANAMVLAYQTNKGNMRVYERSHIRVLQVFPQGANGGRFYSLAHPSCNCGQLLRRCYVVSTLPLQV